MLTQNVDDLHERAGSSKVIHLHGELSKACSADDPYNERFIQRLTPENSEIKPGTKAGDGSLLRPFIVFFGESVPMLEPAAREAMTADIFVIIGTSLIVYPAAGLVNYTKRQCPIYLIDPDDMDNYRMPYLTHIQKGASEGMREFIDLLKQNKL